MSPFAVDKRDIQFCLFEYLNLLDFCKTTEKFSAFDRETIEMSIDTMIKVATDKIAPLNTVMDREGLRFEGGKVTTPKGYKEAYRAVCENGLSAPGKSAELGGGGLPHAAMTAIVEIMASASVAFTMTPGLSSAAGEVIEAYGTEELKKLYVEKLYTGQWAGTMCLTESSAGSAVGDLKTKAKRQGDHYLIEGEKIFISSGEHDLTENIVHLVLARIVGAPPGVKGISLFVVPKVLPAGEGLGPRNALSCGKIEEKMGIHGNSTCTMIFGGDGPCQGWLIGEENQGINYMFRMMNEARIGVGLQGLATSAASYQEALQYARDRVQGVDIKDMKDVNAPRVAIIQHPDVRRNLLSMKAFVEGARALLYSTAHFSELALHHPDETERQNYQNLVELLTPICKAYCSDQGFRMTELGVQIFGGYGYCQEYPQEQYCRDAKIASIYEGTNGIQALDLLGRKVSGKGGLMFMTFLMRMNGFINDNQGHPALGPYVAKLEAARDALTGVVMRFQQAGMEGDMYYPVLNATPFLDLFGTIVFAYLLEDMAVKADAALQKLYAQAGAKTDEAKAKLVAEHPEARYYDGKLHSMRHFVETNLPHAQATCQAILAADKSPLTINFG